MADPPAQAPQLSRRQTQPERDTHTQRMVGEGGRKRNPLLSPSAHKHIHTCVVSPHHLQSISQSISRPPLHARSSRGRLAQ